MAKNKHPIGVVTEILAGARFRVQMPDGKEVIAYLSGQMKNKRINILIHDKVEVVLAPYCGKASNRIIWRH